MKKDKKNKATKGKNKQSVGKNGGLRGFGGQALSSLGKLSTTQKVLGGAALLAAGLGLYSQRNRLGATNTSAVTSAAE